MAENLADPLLDDSITETFEFPTSYIPDTTPPILVSYEVHLDNASVVLTFDETVSFSDLDVREITFFNRGDENATEQYTLRGDMGRETTINFIYVQFFLREDDIIELKARENLLVSSNSTWLENGVFLIEDVNNNDAFERDSTNRLEAGLFTGDFTSPLLQDFELSLDTKILTLIANEPIYLPSVDPTQITLASGRDVTASSYTSYNLTGGSVSYSDPVGSQKRRVDITLTDQDVREIQLNRGLATIPQNAFLSVRPGAFTDMFDNFVVEVPLNESIPVDRFTPDSDAPDLISFTIDLDTGTLDLTFDDTVEPIDSFNPSGIIIQNAAEMSDDTASYMLTADTNTSSPDGYFLTVNLSQTDLNAIKNDLELAVNINTTFITTRASPDHPVHDTSLNNNPLTPILIGLQAANFTPDTSRPHLVEYTLDMNEGLLLLTFNETVRADTFNITNLILGGSANFSSTVFTYQLTGGNSSLPDDIIIIVQLSIEDLNELKRLTPGLATFMSDTYLAFNNETVLDQNENNVVEIETKSALEAARVIRDITPPILVSFDLNMTSEILTLTFNETVDASEIVIRDAITIHSSRNISSSQSHTLQDGIPSTEDSTVISIQLDFDDLNAIKGLRMLAVSQDSTFLSITSDLIRDMAAQRVEAITQEGALQVTNFTDDFTPPELVSFDINLSEDTIYLTFSETIRPESLNFTLISLTDSNITANQTLVYTLTGGNRTSDDTRFLNIVFNKVDSDQLRFFGDLLTSRSNSFIIIEAGAITDMALNEIEEDIQQVLSFTEDGVRPTFVSFDLDLNEGVLALTFSETVRVSSLNVTQISFQDDSNVNFAEDSYSLTEGNSTFGDNTTVIIMLGDTDLNALKRLEPLAVSEDTTFIALTPRAITDTNSNPLVEVSRISARQVDMLTNDTTSPELVSYFLDINSGEITLTFSETVRAETLQADQFSLQSSRNESEEIYEFFNLTSVSFTNSSDSTAIVLEIGLDDLNAIKQLPNLATNFRNSFLSFTEEAISDMFDNQVVPMNRSEAVIARSYLPDITNPNLLGFSVDLNTAELILSFSETVDTSSLNVSGLVLQPEANVTSSESTYRLINSSTSNENGPVVTINIGRDDLNMIKRILELGTNAGNTYLSVESSTITDTVELPVVRIPPDMAEMVTFFQEDTFNPVLMEFSLNMTSGILMLTFDETVNSSSINVAGLSLHPTEDSASSLLGVNGTFDFDGVSLEDSMILTTDSPVINILIDTDQLNMIKLRTDLATERNDTFLRITAGSVADLAFTPRRILQTVQQISLDGFTSDVMPPMLISFSVDLTNATLILVFDEPVDVETLTFNAITLQSAENITNGTFYQLTGGSTNSSNGLEVIIDIAMDDLNLIQRDEELLRDNLTAYISFDSRLVSDMNGNPVIPIPSGSAEQVTMFMDDEVRPRLLAFDLDMNEGLLTLIFSETVNVSSLRANEITLQLLAVVTNVFAHSHTLVRPVTLDSQVDDTSVFIRLNPFDLDEIKRRGIALTEDTVFIAIGSMTILDMAGQNVYPLVNGIFTLPVRNYARDEMMISLDYFTLDLNEELLTLYFSEAVHSMIPLNITHIYLQSHSNATMPGVEIYQLSDSSFIVPTLGTAMIEAALASGVGSGSGSGIQPIVVTGFSGSDSRVVIIRLSLNDLNEIKRRQSLAMTRRNTVYISFDDETVRDTFGNLNDPIFPIFGVRTEVFVSDSIAPALQSFELNLSTDQLTLRFSETVNSASFNPASFTFLSSPGPNPAELYALSGGEVLSSNDPVIVVQLDSLDANRLRNFTELAVSRDTTYLSVDSSGILDMNRNRLAEVTAQMAAVYIRDAINPNLTEFRLDLNQGILYLTFSETVNVSSFNPQSIVLSSTPEVNSTTYMLTGGSAQNYDSTIVILEISDEDLNAIKFFYDLAVDEDTAFISFDESAVRDLSSNAVRVIDITEARAVQEYTPDVTRPRFTAFTFDANSGIMTLFYDETVNVDSFSPPALTLQADQSEALEGRSHILSGGTVLTVNTTVVMLQLTLDDFNQIKRLPDLATTESNTYITFSSDLVADMAGNPVVAVQSPSFLAVSNFTDDTTSPMLMEFNIDLNTGTLTLFFDETVNASTLDVTGFSLQNSLNETENITIFEFTGSRTPSGDGPVIVVEFSFEDLNELKRLPVCVFDQMGGDCYLDFSEDAIADAVGNPVDIPDTPSLPARYQRDVTPPMLTSFAEFNYVNETITLVFSETVSFASIDASELSFQSFFTIYPADGRIRLNGGLIQGPDSHVVTITLLESDVDALKRHPTICFRRNTCWLALTAATLVDLAENSVTAVGLNDARYSERFIVDEQPPTLQYFDLDMESEVLTLFFSEPVNVEFLDPTAITLQGQPSAFLPNQSVTLTGGTTSSLNGRTLLLNLSSEDVVRIKASLDILKEDNETFISFTSDLITDTSHALVPVTPITNPEALQVRDYFEDISGPVLVSSILDLDQDLIILTFDEPVLTSTLNFSHIEIQTTPSFQLSLTPWILSPESVDGSTVIRINLSPEDLIMLKADADFQADIVSNVVSLDDEVLTDTAGNENDAREYPLTAVIPDTTLATLQSFFLDMNTGTLQLTFNDVVNASTFSASGITVQSSNFRGQGEFYTLSSSSYSASPAVGYAINVSLSDADLNEIKYRLNLATEVSNTYLTLGLQTIEDVYGHYIKPIVDGNATRASGYASDDTPPELRGFTLNLNNNLLLLTYSETVTHESFDVSTVLLLNTADGGDEVVPLNSSTPHMRQSHTVVRVQLPQAVIDMITEAPDFGTGLNDTFVMLLNGSVRDTNNNLADSSSIIPATGYVMDRRPPSLIGADLDLDASTLTLMFSETINSMSIDPTQVTIQGSPLRAPQGDFHTLTGGAASTTATNSSRITIVLITNDTDTLKQLSGVATSTANTYILVTNATVEDISGNPNEAILDGQGLQVTGFAGDDVSPTLLFYSLDLTSDELTLTFSETVSVTTFDLSQFTLQSESSMMSAFSYALTGGRVLTTRDAPRVTISLTRSDLNELKKIPGLATSRENTHLSITSSAVADTFGNPVTAIPPSLALQVSMFLDDFEEPILESFELDMDSGMITLYFSETVNVSSLDPSFITLSNFRYVPTRTYTLTGGNFSTVPSPVVMIALLDDDLNAIKSLLDLAVSNRTYISVSPELVVDTSSRPVVRINVTNGLRVSRFTPDTTEPGLENFDLDVDEGLLTLQFSETVLAISVEVREITLLVHVEMGPEDLMDDNTTTGELNATMTDTEEANVTMVTYLRTLVAGNVSTNDSTIITVLLHPLDLNDLKRQTALAVSRDSTFISVTPLTVLDANMNMLMPINQSDPLQVRDFTPDSTPPELESFSLDMDTLLLELTFTETVNAETFDSSEITIQNSPSIEQNGSEYYTLTGGDLVPPAEDDPVLLLMLSRTDSNAIKALRNLAKEEGDTYLSLGPMLVEDMEGFPVVNISNTSARMVSVYTRDVSPPLLMNFDLDADTGLLRLEFDETVDGQTLRVRRLVLQSDVSNSTLGYQSYRLLGDMSVSSVSPIVEFFLSPMDLLAIKNLPSLAISPNDTYLLIRLNAIRDTALSPNGAAELLLSVRNYTYDQTGPVIRGFAVDLTLGIVTLNFNEPVLASSLDATALTALAGPNSNSSFTLTNGTTDSPNGFQIMLVLLNDDLNVIKQMEDLWTEENNTYIAVESFFITDPTVVTDESEPNEVMEIFPDDPLRADLVLADDGVPMVDSFEIDFDSGTLILHFSETINITSFNFSGISFQSDSDTRNSPVSRLYTLTNGTFLSMGDVPDVIINLARDDLNALKALEIGSMSTNIFLTIEEGAVLDQSLNRNAPRLDGINALPVGMYMADISGPVLERFDLNLTSNILTLYFDETVRARTLNVEMITLYGFNLSTEYSLTGGSGTLSPNGPTIEILLSEFDANNIKRDTQLATSDNNTFIALDVFTIEDMVMNDVVNISTSENFPVTDFYPDFARPILRRFDLDLTREILTLYFSETMNIDTFNETQLRLLSLDSGESHSLTEAIIEHDNEPVVFVNLSRADLNVIKQLTGLATSSENTMISITSDLIQDMNENQVEEIPPVNATSVTIFVRDNVPPELENFDLDTDESTLTLFFSETVNTLSLDPRQLTLQDGPAAVDNYTLTGGFTETANSSIVVLNITKTDLDRIKFDLSLATGRDDTYITYTSDLIVDMFGNEVVNRTDGFGLQVRNFTADMTPPTLESYDLDMNLGVLYFTFSETMDAQTFDPTQLSIQMNTSVNLSDPSLIYTLTGGDWSMVDSTEITLYLTVDDQNAIKYRFLVATEENNTYVIHTPLFVQDQNMNRIVPILNGDAVRVTNFTMDTTRPVLVNWTMDLNLGDMILTFDETVNRDSLMVPEMILQDNSPPLDETFALSEPLSHSLDNGTVIAVRFSLEDLNEIKRLSICTDVLRELDCYLSYSNMTIRDMNGNLLVEREVNDSQITQRYIRDSTGPLLIEFVLLDLTAEILTIQFNETVNITSFNTSEVVLKRFWIDPLFPDPTFQFLRLTGPDELLTDEDNTTISFMPTTFDLNRIKQDTTLCTLSPNPNCYIQFSEALVRDMATNPAMPIVSGDARFAESYAMIVIADMVAPNLVNFSISLDSGNVSLTFDETVNVQRFDPTGITFHNGFNSTVFQSHALRGATRFSEEDWIYVDFQLTPDDLTTLKYMEELATELEDTYISITRSTIVDMNDNQVEEIAVDEDSLLPHTYEPDVTDPTLLFFTFNLADDILSLTFDEPVRVNSTIFSNITLQGAANGTLASTNSFTLTGGSVEYGSINKSILLVTLTREDMRVIKLTADLATEDEFSQLPFNTYLSIINGTVLDTAGNPLEAIPFNDALRATRIQLDNRRPVLVSYDIDLDEGTLTLFYDDVVSQTSFEAIELTLHNESNLAGPNNYTLTGGGPQSVLMEADDYFTLFVFSARDLNEIKRNEGLATGRNNTFITHTDMLVADDRNLRIISIPSPLLPPGQSSNYNNMHVSVFTCFQLSEISPCK